MSENDIARRILAKLDASAGVKKNENLLIVTDFIESLRREIAVPKTSSSPLKGASIKHGGSAYEGLAVNEGVDFDIIIEPGKPYIAENFVTHREPNRFFTLEWKPQVYNKGLSDSEGYLDTAEFRNQLFSELNLCVKAVKLPNVKYIHRQRLVSAFLVVLYLDTGLEISLDLVPQIAFHSWGQCPDLKSKEEMPFVLQNYINNNNHNASPIMYFSVAVPGKAHHPRLCNISFAPLEKKFVTSDVKVRSMIRLVKFVADRCDWKKEYGFQSYFAKRMAVKHYDALKDMDLWNGYLTILRSLWQEFQFGTVDGYFISNQVTYFGNLESAKMLQIKINNTITRSAKEIECLL